MKWSSLRGGGSWRLRGGRRGWFCLSAGGWKDRGWFRFAELSFVNILLVNF